MYHKRQPANALYACDASVILPNGVSSYTNGVSSYTNGVSSYTNGVSSYTNGVGSYTNGVVIMREAKT